MSDAQSAYRKSPRERIEYALMLLGKQGQADVAEDALAAMDELVMFEKRGERGHIGIQDWACHG